MGIIYYNSWLNQYKQPFGAVEKNKQVNFSIRVEMENVEQVLLVIRKEGGNQDLGYLPMKLSEKMYRYTYTLDQGKGLYFYYFAIRLKNELGESYSLYYGSQRGQGGEGNSDVDENRISSYQLTCFDHADPAPKWYKEAVFYQIFPDRFNNGNEDQRVNSPKNNSFLYGSHDDEPLYIKNEQGEVIRWDFQGGNLQGILQKVPYLKDLGVTAVYLTPIFESVSNHRYDTANYLAIDKMLGDKEDFKQLIDVLHENEMQIILDGVFNHVGKNSLYFNYNGSYGEMIGAYRNITSPYFSWFTFDEYPNHYRSWWGITDLPEVNKENKTFQEFIYGKSDSVLTKWTDFGIDGWRLDVADELPDFFIQGIRKNQNSYVDKVLIGEVWEDASNKISYDKRRQYILGEGLHGVMNYPFRENILDLLLSEKTTEQVAKNLTVLAENYPKDVLKNNLNNLGTHDTERLLTVLDENQTKLISAFSLLTVLPGVPCIYYGDEVGLTGGKDPENRKYFPWGKEQQEIKQVFKKWIQIRKTTNALKEGEFLPFYSADLLGVVRYQENTWCCYIINPQDESRVIDVDTFQFTKDCPISKEELRIALSDVKVAAYDHYFVNKK